MNHLCRATTRGSNTALQMHDKPKASDLAPYSMNDVVKTQSYGDTAFTMRLCSKLPFTKRLATYPQTMAFSNPQHLLRQRLNRRTYTMRQYLFDPPRIPARLHTTRDRLSSKSKEIDVSEETCSTVRLVQVTTPTDTSSMTMSWKSLPSLEADRSHSTKRDVVQPMLWSFFMVVLMVTMFTIAVSKEWIVPYEGITSGKKGGKRGR